LCCGVLELFRCFIETLAHPFPQLDTQLVDAIVVQAHAGGHLHLEPGGKVQTELSGQVHHAHARLLYVLERDVLQHRVENIVVLVGPDRHFSLAPALADHPSFDLAAPQDIRVDADHGLRLLVARLDLRPLVARLAQRRFGSRPHRILSK
jgi:hypothetical protein